jgi:hypothetical protein
MKNLAAFPHAAHLLACGELEIYITGKSAACPPIKELRQVRGNDVHSTEPRSGEVSPLD